MCLLNILSPVFIFAFIFHCRSFSLWWPLAFSLSHSRFECSCFSSYKIRPLFFQSLALTVSLLERFSLDCRKGLVLVLVLVLLRPLVD